MYNIDNEALSASSSTPDSYPHYAKLVDLSSFARKGIKTQKMERIEQIQQEADHIGEFFSEYCVNSFTLCSRRLDFKVD